MKKMFLCESNAGYLVCAIDYDRGTAWYLIPSTCDLDKVEQQFAELVESVSYDEMYCEISNADRPDWGTLSLTDMQSDLDRMSILNEQEAM